MGLHETSTSNFQVFWWFCPYVLSNNLVQKVAKVGVGGQSEGPAKVPVQHVLLVSSVLISRHSAVVVGFIIGFTSNADIIIIIIIIIIILISQGSSH